MTSPPSTGNTAPDPAEGDQSRLKLRLQIYLGEEIAMGPGKADLLDAIAAQGSISAAARAMDMSYRRAWLLVDVMNRCWMAPLVETVAGGGHERGARLTETGRQVLSRYRALQRNVGAMADSGFASDLADLLGAPPTVSHPQDV